MENQSISNAVAAEAVAVKNETVINSRYKIKELALAGLFIAIVFVTTMFVNIRLPIAINGGLIHLGNVMLFTISILFGKKHGAAAGAFGMGLFDIMSGWAAWAPFTFIVRGVMGYIIGSVANSRGKKGNSFFLNLFAIVLGSIWMIAGYYVTEVILYGNWVVPVSSIPGNITQIVIGMVSLAIVPVLKKAKISG